MLVLGLWEFQRVVGAAFWMWILKGDDTRCVDHPSTVVVMYIAASRPCGRAIALRCLEACREGTKGSNQSRVPHWERGGSVVPSLLRLQSCFAS